MHEHKAFNVLLVVGNDHDWSFVNDVAKQVFPTSFDRSFCIGVVPNLADFKAGCLSDLCQFTGYTSSA